MKSFSNHLVALSLATLSGIAGAAPAFTVTYEAPGVTDTTAAFTTKGVERFTTRQTGLNQSFTTTFGMTGSGAITGTYTNVDIANQNLYGGAEGNYALTSTGSASSAIYSLSLSSADPVTYFGFWLSALDAGNQLKFFKGDELVFSFSPDAVLALTGSCATGTSNPYCGNPKTGENTPQPYVFLNFFDQDASGFDRVEFSETVANSGYESDNHTVGRYVTTSGTVLNPVPEPGSLSLLGLSAVALVAARKRKKR
ncbi:PEP-CTERM sorting domain-containing protein [Massilia forsythiae]|uniref:PEP-CTERM sorting domain-containing protein n=1 Tax=Massilia forsythiae TaxID=2728020 RepID=A0A7Z2VZW0_9BURK|nr:PEP-CTERM sorting domain-containing protein [Massilia forsythiae]QJE02492.1 PEP-CTERM sorting domain-containing protein [Massilia forsythiae]